MQKNLNDALNLVADRAAEEPRMEVPDGGIVFVRRANEDEIVPIHELTKEQIFDNVAPLSVVSEVYKRNQDSFWTLTAPRTRKGRLPAGRLCRHGMRQARLTAPSGACHEPALTVSISQACGI
jgi:hypothetical protein